MDAFVELLQWNILLVGYALTIAIELPILYLGLSDQHSRRRRIFAGLWLSACTYPLVALVFPEVFDPKEERLAYLLLAESVAHFGECLLFYFAFAPLKHFWRDMIAVFLANLASFGPVEILYWIFPTGGAAGG